MAARSIEYHLKKYHAELVATFKANLKNPPDLTWLFSRPPKLRFRPDYLTFHNLGTSFLRRKTNRLLALLHKSSWQKLIFPRIYEPTRTAINDQYFNYINERSKLQDSDTIDSYRALQRNLYALFTDIEHHFTKLTFTEFFGFWAQVLRIYSWHLLKSEDMHEDEKYQHNAWAMNLVPTVWEALRQAKDPLKMAVFLSIRANWIDLAEETVSPFLSHFPQELQQLLSQPDLIDAQTQGHCYHWERFSDFFSSEPKTILYEVDNSGEVVFDLITIELLVGKGHRIIICAKEKPILNDVTKDDLTRLLHQKPFAYLKSQLGHSVWVMSSGACSTSKNVLESSKEYQDTYDKVDAVILKGQGNFAGMPMGGRFWGRFIPYPYKKPVFYLMSIKSPMMLWALSTVMHQKRVPELKSPFLYYFNPADPTTFPSRV